MFSDPVVMSLLIAGFIPGVISALRRRGVGVIRGSVAGTEPNGVELRAAMRPGRVFRPLGFGGCAPWRLLNDKFGRDSAPLIQFGFHVIGDQHVCEVQVRPGRRPYMLKVEANDELAKAKDQQAKEVLYIRTGNQTVPLDFMEAVRYAGERWPAR